RAFMKGAAIGALAFTVGGAEVLLTPRAARAQGVPLRTLTAAQAATLDALGETLAPGARQAGISHFVDQQISIPPEEALLDARAGAVRRRGVWQAGARPCRTAAGVRVAGGETISSAVPTVCCGGGGRAGGGGSVRPPSGRGAPGPSPSYSSRPPRV